MNRIDSQAPDFLEGFSDYHRAKFTPVIGGIREFMDVIPSWSLFENFDATEGHNSEIGRLTAYDPTEPCCGISGFVRFVGREHGPKGFLYITELSPILRQALEARALAVPADTISFQIRIWDGAVFLDYEHSQIIGGRCLVQIRRESIPETWNC